MAFDKAAGHGNLPNGNFSSIIYSKKTQNAFRTLNAARHRREIEVREIRRCSHGWGEDAGSPIRSFGPGYQT
mgnify:CR=1 FL=1